MRLADFILANIEPILAEWEAFARGVWTGAVANPVALRDHAQDILRATALVPVAHAAGFYPSGTLRPPPAVSQGVVRAPHS